MLAEYDAERDTARRVADARRIADRHEIVDAGDVLAALLAAFNDSVEWLEAAKAMVSDLVETRYRTATGEHIRGEIVVMERALDRVARQGSDLLRLGLEARLTRLQEAQEAAVIGALSSAVSELGDLLGFDPAAADVQAVVASHLAAVES